MIVIGLDPGYEKSAVVTFNGLTVTDCGIEINDSILEFVLDNHAPERVLVIEQIESFGMAVGRETFETVYWTGRFRQAWSPYRCDRIPRRTVKTHLCHSARATDGNIRQALIDRFGPTTEKAIGKKKSPGPLHDVKSHCWAALAVAVTWFDLHAHEDPIRPGVSAEFF